jgi:hypothetical protein
MMGNKKLSEIKAALTALLGYLPDGSPRKRLNREVEMARQDPKRDEQSLRKLLAALERETRKITRAKKRRPVRKR